MKRLILATMAFCALAYAGAESLSPSAALGRLRKTDSFRRVAAMQREQMNLVAELPNLYVFSSGSGYVVVPSDDVAAPLLGYVDVGEFDLAANPALASWLEFYSEEIESAIESGAIAYDDADATVDERVDIAPLLTTKWNQLSPYNSMCPELNGKLCVTGCVATAMSQVMNYHEWPDVGEGSNSYNWQRGGKTLSCNFAETHFDWANMADEYSASSSQTEIDAVAQLMYATGISINTGYSSDQSGAASAAIGSALINYFKYDRAMWLAERNRYTLEDWTALVYSELSAGRPVIYSGKTKQGGGHQFVCDGYRANDGFFHFNWGWGGVADGYFALTALNPRQTGTGGSSGGYNYEQDATIGLMKAQEGSKPHYEVVSYGSLTASPTSVACGENVTFGGGFSNISFLNLPANTRIGVKFRTFGSDAVRYVYFTESRSIPASMGYQTITVKMPAKLTDGKYAVTPVYRISGAGWADMSVPLDCVRILKATVADGTITFSEYDAAEEEAESGIISIDAATPAADAAWYTIDGKRLAGKPSASGLYIHGGRKVLI